MTTTTATRTRPFTSPHRVDPIRQQAIEIREEHFSNRKKAIDDMARSDPTQDRFYWTMVYDLEHAPSVTGRQRLLESGIIPVPPQELIEDSDLHDELWTVIEGMSVCGIFLLNTGHMNDRELYARLYYRILDEPTRLMPPASEACEYIDCLHPMDLDYPIGSKYAKKIGSGIPPSLSNSYKRGPVYAKIGVINERDTFLPRPAPIS
jgi:hypothetical protein